MASVDVNVDGFPTIQRMVADSAYIKFIIGPAGSAKTSGCIKEMMMHAMLQTPNRDGIRYTRWLIVRNTYNLMKKNTIPSMKNFLGDVIKFSASIPPSGYGRVPLPDNTFMDIEIEFLSMDSDDAVSKLLGAEPTFAFLDEISELPEIVVEAVISRVGRYPSMHKGKPSWIGVLGATNGPNESHWLHDWSELPDDNFAAIEEVLGRKYFSLYQQPPALLRPEKVGDPWLPNPEAENIENLAEGYGYYFKMLTQSDERITAYVEGKFSPLKSGQVIFPEFRKAMHIIPEDAIALEGYTPIMLSFDFGRTPICVVGIVNKFGGIIVIDEHVGVDMGIATLWDTIAKPGIRGYVKNYSVFGAYGDPSGKHERDTLDLSPFGIIKDRGIDISTPWGESNAIDLRLEAVRRRLTTIDTEGRPMLMVSSRCKMVIQAFQKGYVWENKSASGDPDKAKDYPTKSHKNHVSDLMDGVQYMCLGYDAEYVVGRQRDTRIKPKTKPGRGLTIKSR